MSGSGIGTIPGSVSVGIPTIAKVQLDSLARLEMRPSSGCLVSLGLGRKRIHVFIIYFKSVLTRAGQTAEMTRLDWTGMDWTVWVMSG